MFLHMLLWLQVTKLTFIYLVMSTSKLFATGRKVILDNYTKGLFTGREWQFGMQLQILEFGALTFLKRKTRWFLSLPIVMCTCWRAFWSQSYRISKKMLQSGFNKMEQLPILQKINGCFTRTLSRELNLFAWRFWMASTFAWCFTCDYFLWNYVKAEVYKHRPTTIDQLKVSIRQTISEIPQEMTRKVMENFSNRLQQCIAAQGHHLEDVIFKT